MNMKILVVCSGNSGKIRGYPQTRKILNKIIREKHLRKFTDEQIYHITLNYWKTLR